ncbi:MAG: glycosyltransferase [Planctomycetota bacterium]
MIQGRNIVCVASNWSDHPTSKHHIMRRLARENDIIWVNYHASRRPQLTRADLALAVRRLWQTAQNRVRRFGAGRNAGPGSRGRIDVLSPLLLPLPDSPFAQRWNVCTLRRCITQALRRLPERPVQLWLFAPDLPGLIGQLRAERVVYYCVDDFAAFSGYNAALIENLETLTIAASHIVITTSVKLYEERRRVHACVHLVPHGVDFAHFAAAPALPAAAIPRELQRLPRPVLGYMGQVCDYMDFALLAAAARARPEWSFVFVGDVRCDVGPLAALENVHLLGGRPYAELPRYCRGFDVGLIPFRLNRLTRAVNPIKLQEYLAAGLPIVSAPLAAVLPHAPAVRLASTLEEFLSACEAALAARSAGDLQSGTIQDLVRGESWAARLELISRLVMELPPTRQPAGPEHKPGIAQTAPSAARRPQRTAPVPTGLVSGNHVTSPGSAQ